MRITNYQDRYYGGAAMIRLYHFDLARNVIDVETFAPWFLSRDPRKRTALEAEAIELTGDADRFSLDIDFTARFAGFAPPALPAPRPAAQVVDRNTAAYWRFDAAGQSVTDGSVIRDLTGYGNDLTVRRLANSTADTLKLTAEHHDGAPAHASLYFDGGKSPHRGRDPADRPERRRQQREGPQGLHHNRTLKLAQVLPGGPLLPVRSPDRRDFATHSVRLSS